jgi:hypothetical protein
VYEPFDYPAATVLDAAPATGLNLTGNYTPLGPIIFQKVVVASPGLNYGNLVGAPTAAGNRINQEVGTTAGGATASIDQDVLVNAGDAIFFSALFTLDDSSNGNRLASIALTNDDNGDEIAFGESAVGVRAIRVSAQTVATGQFIAAGADNSFTNGQTLLLIGRYTNHAAADGDNVQLIGYDTAGSISLPATFDPLDPNAQFSYTLGGLFDIDMTKVTSVTFRIRGDNNNFIDELRIGSTYVSVVPEPETAWLLLLGAAGMIGCARRITAASLPPGD